MLYNDNAKIIDAANYYYNTHIDMYCIVGTTLCADNLGDLAPLFASSDLLTEIPMPDYVTEDYDGAEW